MGTTKASVSFNQYFNRSFDGPGAEYADSAVVERNGGEKPHSRAQKHLLLILGASERKLGLYAYPALRLRLPNQSCRVPDLCAFLGAEPEEDVPATPPCLVVEIVSRDDRYSDIVAKLEEFRHWGVPNVWLVDPWEKRLNVYTESGLIFVPAFRLTEPAIEITAAEIFAD